jgi:hypothetical protein
LFVSSWGTSFSFLHADSTRVMTRLVGSLWADFWQIGPGNGESSGLCMLKN